MRILTLLFVVQWVWAAHAINTGKTARVLPFLGKELLSTHNAKSKSARSVAKASLVTALSTRGGNFTIPPPEVAPVQPPQEAVVEVKPAAEPEIRNPEGATIRNEVSNLVKSIVGVGVLSLPAGVASFGSAPSAFIPAAVLITIIGILSGYGFALIGRVCAYTGATSYRDAWSRSVGEKTAWIPAWSVTCKTFLACLAYSMVLADTFSKLWRSDRTITLLAVTCFVLTPLCLMKNLKALAPFSALGVFGMAYTALAMTLRWLDGSYAVASGEEPMGLAAEVARHLRPEFGNMGIDSVFSPNALVLVCMLSTAYMVRTRTI